MCWLRKARLQAQEQALKALWHASHGAGIASADDVYNGVGNGVKGGPKPDKWEAQRGQDAQRGHAQWGRALVPVRACWHMA
jgi:hypothetical protein